VNESLPEGSGQASEGGAEATHEANLAELAALEEAESGARIAVVCAAVEEDARIAEEQAAALAVAAAEAVEEMRQRAVAAAEEATEVARAAAEEAREAAQAVADELSESAGAVADQAREEAAAAAEQAHEVAAAAAEQALAKLAVLSEHEAKLREDFVAAYDQASAQLEGQIKALMGMANNMDAMRSATLGAEQVRAFMEEEALARKRIFNDAAKELATEAALLAKDRATRMLHAKMVADVTTPERLEELEEKMRTAVDLEEQGCFLAITKGWEATRRADALLQMAKQKLAEWFGDRPDPSSIDECAAFEAARREELEYNANVAMAQLHALQEPADEEARVCLFQDVQDFLARVASEAIALFVEAIQDPKAAYQKTLLAIENHRDHALRLGRNLVVDLTANGVPFPALQLAETVKTRVRAIPDQIGISPEQANVVREASLFAWTEGCGQAHDYYANQNNPCMPAKCVVM
jgi:hypothetical protein